MSEATEVETDFAAMMQELSARAANEGSRRDAQLSAGMTSMISAIHSLGQRVESLEESIVRKFEAMQFDRLEQQIAALRESETVNQKLFDSLHQELISYRDNFVRDALQKPVVRDLIVLFDDVSGIAAQMEKASTADGADPMLAQLRDNVANTLHFLIEILHRLEVVEIEEKEKVDRQLHRVISVEPAATAEDDGRIVRRLKRGFIWHDKVLRAEEVVMQRFRPEEA
ncbi:MAG TPA: nucleotide exchange factor GrpE [Chthoniobacterales bacterium]|nr:nucleotide exchange factor GrpE [Chthoniobacterales bacterium]